MIDPHRNYGAYVADNDFADPRANHPDSVLAGPDTLDDCNICVSHFILDRRAEVVVMLKAVLPKRVRDRDATHTGARPVKDLGCSMFTENPRFDICRSDLEFSCQVHPKAPTVEKCACAENAIMPGEFARQKRQRIRWIGYDEQHGIWRRRCYQRNNLTINLGIPVQETQAPQRIIAIRC